MNSEITQILQQAKAAIEYVEVTSAKGFLPDDTSTLQEYSKGLRDLTSCVNKLPSVISELRTTVHQKRMEVQQLRKRDD